MHEHGISPAPRLELDAWLETKAPIVIEYLRQLDKWFRRLRDTIPKMHHFDAAINPASVAANSTSEQTFTVTGVGTGDVVIINKPTHTSGLGIVNARVSASNTVAITFQNTTASAIDAPLETYLIIVIRS